MFAFDIETVPLPEALAAPFPRDEFSPPSNYKADAAIEGWYAKREADWYAARAKACALNPRLGRIIALGTADALSEGATLARESADERELLTTFWKRAARAVHEAGPNADDDEPTHLVTWNGSWDLRFILVRSMLHRVEPRVAPRVVRGWLRRYDLRTHFDVKAALLNHETALMTSAGEGLDAWAGAFGLEPKPMNGGDVYDAMLAGRWDDIETYVRHDARTTWQVFVRTRGWLTGAV